MRLLQTLPFLLLLFTGGIFGSQRERIQKQLQQLLHRQSYWIVHPQQKSNFVYQQQQSNWVYHFPECYKEFAHKNVKQYRAHMQRHEERRIYRLNAPTKESQFYWRNYIARKYYPHLPLQSHIMPQGRSFQTPIYFENLIFNPNEVQPVLGDGNCMYRSISWALTGTEDYYGSIRWLVADALQKSANEGWVKEILLPNGGTYQQMQAALKEQMRVIKYTKTFGEIDSLIAAAKAFNVIVLVYTQYTSEKGSWMSFSPDTMSMKTTADKQNPALFTVPLRMSMQTVHYEPILNIKQVSTSEDDNWL